MPITKSFLNAALGQYRAIKHQRSRNAYLKGGRIPWSAGYLDFRNEQIEQVLNNPELLQRFAGDQPLPANYGERLDERIVEYPWVLSRLRSGSEVVLDAGSTLNFEFLLKRVRDKTILIYTLAPEGTFSLPNVSYIYGDLRANILKDQLIDTIICISTLEHVGMDNTQLYTTDARFQESNLEMYRAVLLEFRRLLKPGGHLLLTVPFGRYENHGWLQQFNASMISDVITTVGGTSAHCSYYRYTPMGWVLSNPEECADCRYFNIHAEKGHAPDFAAAARAVACLEVIL